MDRGYGNEGEALVGKVLVLNVLSRNIQMEGKAMIKVQASEGASYRKSHLSSAEMDE